MIGGAKGYFHLAENRIAIQEGMSEVQTVKTTIHEMAHQKLHSIKAQQLKEGKQSRASKEVEAESVAYVVCKHFGIDTSDYSFSYVAGWSEGKETPEFKESLQTIRRAASEMITSLDDKFMELNQMLQEQRAENPFEQANEDPVGFIRIILSLFMEQTGRLRLPWSSLKKPWRRTRKRPLKRKVP